MTVVIAIRDGSRMHLVADRRSVKTSGIYNDTAFKIVHHHNLMLGAAGMAGFCQSLVDKFQPPDYAPYAARGERDYFIHELYPAILDLRDKTKADKSVVIAVVRKHIYLVTVSPTAPSYTQVDRDVAAIGIGDDYVIGYIESQLNMKKKGSKMALLKIAADAIASFSQYNNGVSRASESLTMLSTGELQRG